MLMSCCSAVWSVKKQAAYLGWLMSTVILCLSLAHYLLFFHFFFWDFLLYAIILGKREGHNCPDPWSGHLKWICTAPPSTSFHSTTSWQKLHQTTPTCEQQTSLQIMHVFSLYFRLTPTLLHFCTFSTDVFCAHCWIMLSWLPYKCSRGWSATER